MNENDSMNLINHNHIIYSANTNMVRIFRISKFLYISLIITILSLIMLFDDNIYDSNIINTTYTYLFIEIVSLTIFSFKIGRIRYSRFWRITSSITRFIWITLTFFGIMDLLSETKTTDSLLYYILWYVYGSNILYILSGICLSCIMCLCINQTYPSDQRRAIISIIDDNTDIQLFSNVLKIPGLYNDTMCSICYENFKNDDEVKLLPCKHYYHVNCIDLWLNEHNNCPICRTNVLDP